MTISVMKGVPRGESNKVTGLPLNINRPMPRVTSAAEVALPQKERLRQKTI